MITGLPRYQNQILKITLINKIFELRTNKFNLFINILSSVYKQVGKGVDFI